MSFRIGYGYDCHRFTTGTFVMLGGVKIPNDQGVLAHSDGDVLLHAIIDALLGALAEGDIGSHFPDTDPANANLESRVMLSQVIDLMRHRGYSLANVDSTVIAEAPRLSTHIASMREKIAADLGVAADQVSIKATTHEGMGAMGRQEGLAAHAVVLVQKMLR